MSVDFYWWRCWRFNSLESRLNSEKMFWKVKKMWNWEVFVTFWGGCARVMDEFCRFPGFLMDFYNFLWILNLKLLKNVENTNFWFIFHPKWQMTVSQNYLLLQPFHSWTPRKEIPNIIHFSCKINKLRGKKC